MARRDWVRRNTRNTARLAGAPQTALIDSSGIPQTFLGTSAARRPTIRRLADHTNQEGRRMTDTKKIGTKKIGTKKTALPTGRRCWFALAAALAAFAADAQCDGIIEALERARGESRVAQLLVDANGHPNGTEPVTLRIDDVVYEGFDGVEYRTRPADTGDPLAAALRRDPLRARCEELGADRFAGIKAFRFRFLHPELDGANGDVTLLVARKSGLPLFHTYDSLGSRGFAWIYGSRVRTPPTALARRSAFPPHRDAGQPLYTDDRNLRGQT
jgi:hypothetical protein